jgi:AcrR family transcriptional regulator
MTETPAPNPAKKPYHHGALKSALVAAGIEILEARGLESLSLRAIAAHVGVSHTAPKNHFGSLRGLLTAIAAEGFSRHAAYMRADDLATPTHSDTDPRLIRQRSAMQGYIRFAANHPHLFRLMFSPALCSFDDPDLRAAAAQSYGVLRSISEGLDWDKSHAPNADLRAQMMLWSLVHGYATLRQTGMLPPPVIGPDGRAEPAILDIADIMPLFGYLPKT